MLLPETVPKNFVGRSAWTVSDGNIFLKIIQNHKHPKQQFYKVYKMFLKLYQSVPFVDTR